MPSDPCESTLPKEWIDQRRVWNDKYVLKGTYRDLFRRIESQCRPGDSLEIGSGIGVLKEHKPDLTTLDVTFAPWLNVVANAQCLPFSEAAFDNVVAVDALHHLPRPLKFLAEARRVLRPGGRLILMEPAITIGSWFFYRFIHQERVDLRADPFSGEPMCSDDPYDANQAIPTLLFKRLPGRLQRELPGLHLSTLEHLSILAYPLSGGFKPWSLLPGVLLRPLLAFEDVLPRAVRRTFGFRLLAVLTRDHPGSP